MVFLNLQQQSVKEIDMRVDVQRDSEFSVDNTFSFHVSYGDDNASCVSQLRQEIELQDNPSAFRIKVEFIGTYSCEGIETEDDKKEAHVQAYMLLFPYVQRMIAQLTMEAGLPPLTLAMAKLTPEDVQLGSIN